MISEEEKMKHRIMGEIFDSLFDAMSEEQESVKTMKYSKKIRDNITKILENTYKLLKNDETEKVRRTDAFMEEIYKLIKEFMKQENIEGV